MTPGFRRTEQGLICDDKRRGSGKWHALMIHKILRTEIYTGDMVQGKSRIIARKQIPVSPEKYTVVRGTHEPIISHEQYEQVQIMLNKTAQICREREKRAYSPNLLKGKIFCAACGYPLHRQRKKRKKTADQYYYYCITNTRVKKDSCPGVMIYEKELFDTLLTVIRKALESVLGESSIISKTAAEDQGRQLAVIEREIRRREGQIAGLYENLTLGVISRGEYDSLREQFEKRLIELTAEAAHLREELQTQEESSRKLRTLREEDAALRENPVLTKELIDRLIDRIDVSPDKSLHIRWTFKSEYGEEDPSCPPM